MIFPVKRVKEELINEFAVSNVTVNHSEINLLALCGYADILQNFLETSNYNPNKRDPDGLDLFCYAVLSNDYDMESRKSICKRTEKEQRSGLSGTDHYDIRA